jgi:hypothetical protein
MGIHARYQDIDDEEYEEEETGIIPILATVSKWFIRIGIVLAVIVGIYYLVKLQIVNLLLFIIGLIIAYFFGYFFMFCLDKLTSLNNK